MKIPLETLARFTEEVYRNALYPEEQISTIVKILTYAQIRGNIQSLIQLAKGVPTFHAKGPIQLIKESALSCYLDGNDHIGIWVMDRCKQEVMDKAKQYGFGIAGCYNAAPPGTAALGYYVEAIAEKGLIAFAFSGSSKFVAPYGGYQPLLGSNPIAIGLPCEGKPIVIDMATSIMPVFKVVEALLTQKPLSAGCAFDNKGNSTIDPNDILQEGGSLTLFGNSPKAFALSVFVEAMTGPLVGASFGNHGDTQNNWGNVIYAIDPELLAGGQVFKKQMALLRTALKNSSPLSADHEIFLPGERAAQQAEAALKNGWIEIDDYLARQLKIP